MNLSDLKDQLLECNMEKNFAFISYSSADRETVWSDVIELQRRGFNLWIDEANLDKSKASWKDDALKAIEDYECVLLIFFVSKHSLTSVSCLNELNKTLEDVTIESHFPDKIGFVAVEIEPIGDIGQYMEKISRKIRSSNLTKNEKSQKTSTLFQFKSKWFQDNEKVRIHSRIEPDRIGNYYSDLENELVKKGLEAATSTVSDFENADDLKKLVRTLFQQSSAVYDRLTSSNGRFSFFECNDKLFPSARPIQSKYCKTDEKEIADISKFYLEKGNAL